MIISQYLEDCEAQLVMALKSYSPSKVTWFAVFLLASILALTSPHNLCAQQSNSAGLDEPSNQFQDCPSADAFEPSSITQLTFFTPIGSSEFWIPESIEYELNSQLLLRKHPIIRAQDSGAGQNQGRRSSFGSFFSISTYWNLLFNTSYGGDALQKSGPTTGVTGQIRNPIVTDSRIRSNRVGRVLASGSHWVPARLDLDTMLSKLSSETLDELGVVKGPYSAIEGPGFNFITAELRNAPRYDERAEHHGSTSLSYGFNGQQLYAQQTLMGGDPTWGYLFGYGHQTGNDYRPGEGDPIPASYNSRDVTLAVRRNLSTGTEANLHVIRLDQTGVEYPGQAFDMDFLVTDAYEFALASDELSLFDEFAFEAWYNRTRFEGNANSPGKRRQFPTFARLGLIGFTDVDSMSVGYRASGTWRASTSTMTLGSDIRYVKQELNEFTTATQGLPSDFLYVADSPIPRSHTSNPGLFCESSCDLCPHLKLSGGARFDWYSANIEENDVALRPVGPSNPGIPANTYGDFVGTTDFDRDYFLLLGFASTEYQLCAHWTLTAAVGHAERPPSLTELYAAAPFMFVLQNGINSVTGDPTLRPERLWQIDGGLRYENETTRFGIDTFYAWVKDYITYETKSIPLFGAGTNLLFVNTELAVLTGYETYIDYRTTPNSDLFANLKFVKGSDVARQEPLPSISPLESRLGIRLHEATAADPAWTVELAVRIVGSQDRVAESVRETPTNSFLTWDLRGSYRPSTNWLFTIGIENITDKTYREHLDYRDPLRPNAPTMLQPGVNIYYACNATY